MPRCPQCGNQEPTLVSAEPANHWLCESCGKEWTDTSAEPKPASVESVPRER